MQDQTFTLDNCTVLTVDEKDHFFPLGRIVIRKGRIIDLGHAGQIPSQGKSIDLEGALVLPGLVNTHTHSHSSIFRSLADDMHLMDWLKKAIWPMEKRLTSTCIAAAARLSCFEYLRNGITAIADQIYFPDTVAAATSESGIRSFLAASVFSGTGPAPGTSDTFADACGFVEKWQGREEFTRIYPCIGPHSPYSVDVDLFRKIVVYAEQKNLLIHTHISETKSENRILRERFGVSPTEWLHNIGVFRQPVLAAHSIHLDEFDLDLYRRNGVSVSYNPVSNLKLVSGMMDLKAMWELGITVGIGTDGAQSNNSMDLLRDLRTGVLIQKQLVGDPTFFNARQALRMATINGAKALHFEREIGSLETGKRADLIALDTKSPRLVPLHRERLENIYSLLCYSALGADVRDVMIEGQWVVRNKAVLTLKEDLIYSDALAASEALLKSNS